MSDHLSQSLPGSRGSEGVKFQIISDLHLEHDHQYANFNITPTAPFLILAGDTGALADYREYSNFLRRHCSLFAHMYLVLGNHEFHGTSYEEALTQAQRLENETDLSNKVTILHRRRVDIDANVTLLGCTLWSHIPNEAREAVENKVKDYRYIDEWSVDKHNFEHQNDLDWLKRQLQQLHQTEPMRKVVIITHHAPSNHDTSNPKHTSNPWTSAFSTPLLEGEAGTWTGLSNVKYWIFGHTHWTTSYRVAGLTLLSNQRGYARGDSSLSTDTQNRNVEPKAVLSKEHTFDETRTIVL